MIVNQGYKPQCREFNGPTPHSTALRARPTLTRPADHLILERRKKEEARHKVLEFTKYQETWDMRTTWQKNTDRRIISGTIERHVQDAMTQYQTSIEERRERLRSLFEEEEKEQLEEMENKTETVSERQVRMKERARTLRERRESERQQLVADKLDQQFREQNAELRADQSRRGQDQVCAERGQQLLLRQEAQRRRREEEEEVFQELWEADCRAKEAREKEEALRRRRSHQEQAEVLDWQTKEVDRRREEQRLLKEEEARLLREQREVQALTEQREQLQKLQAQEAQRRQLDRDLRLKMKRLGLQRQDELALDISILQQLLEPGHDQGAASRRKSEIRLEQERYRQHLADEQERQRGEEAEYDRLMEAELREAWRRRAEKNRVEREGRDRLMREVMATRQLQIQHKLDVNTDLQQQMEEEREELNRNMQENKIVDEEQKISQRRACLQYQADLLAQIRQREQQALELKTQESMEHQRGLEAEEQHSKRVQEAMSSRPRSDAASRRGQHPFRRSPSITTAANP
ncbi:cilia- and flagella-associated protein 53 [Gadus chalcogrammus]|uniref:cilia- and flagella-associated protein 53 n=1 Tax=Gadus chalcogrammus TaxID=1042646 RepID=UPI0024C22AAD|nr:cilia- and flagella-associated protein 53 [Gadus chalcogrammus]